MWKVANISWSRASASSWLILGGRRPPSFSLSEESTTYLGSEENDLDTCQIQNIPFEVGHLALPVLSQELHCAADREKLSSRFLKRRSSLPPFKWRSEEENEGKVSYGEYELGVRVLGKLGPGQSGPGQLGPGQLGPGAQFATDNWAPDNRAPGPKCPGPNLPLFQGGQLGPGAQFATF